MIWFIIAVCVIGFVLFSFFNPMTRAVSKLQKTMAFFDYGELVYEISTYDDCMWTLPPMRLSRNDIRLYYFGNNYVYLSHCGKDITADDLNRIIKYLKKSRYFLQ